MPALPQLQTLALYAALLGLLCVVLGLLTVRARTAARVSLGDGGDPVLLRRSRAHANFAEYVPMALILIGGAAIGGAHAWFVHGCGILLIAARLAHARAIYADEVRLRVFGTAGTFLVILAASVHILINAAIYP